jgi:hypothetical protein
LDQSKHQHENIGRERRIEQICQLRTLYSAQPFRPAIFQDERQSRFELNIQNTQRQILQFAQRGLLCKSNAFFPFSQLDIIVQLFLNEKNAISVEEVYDEHKYVCVIENYLPEASKPFSDIFQQVIKSRAESTSKMRDNEFTMTLYENLVKHRNKTAFWSRNLNLNSFEFSSLNRQKTARGQRI